jgi:hypothetical protein
LRQRRAVIARDGAFLLGSRLASVYVDDFGDGGGRRRFPQRRAVSARDGALLLESRVASFLCDRLDDAQEESSIIQIKISTIQIKISIILHIGRRAWYQALRGRLDDLL